jgi:hypothetical protein
MAGAVTSPSVHGRLVNQPVRQFALRAADWNEREGDVMSGHVSG